MKKQIKKNNLTPKDKVIKNKKPVKVKKTTKVTKKKEEPFIQTREDEIYDFNFNKIKISLATPKQILKWSWGEVVNSETLNYRTFLPEKGGLFCQKIFGPIKYYECLCGKYKTTKYKKNVCEKCEVEIGDPQVRRQRLGHIKLRIPVAHIWFFRAVPSKLGLLLNLNVKDLEKIIYYEAYIVLNKGLTSCKIGSVLTEEEYVQIKNEYINDPQLEVGMGAESLLKYINDLDFKRHKEKLLYKYKNTNSSALKTKYLKQINAINSFIASDNEISGLFIKVLPVLPPDLRPLVPLEGGRFASSDLNDLYRRIINRNNRLKRFLNISTTSEDIIIREKRLLQESVDALIDNARKKNPLVGANKRQYKSLTDGLKGKQGRFRFNLLGKRVDYSGRTVITVGPNLYLHQCGIPKKMLVELFKPFIISKLTKLNLAPSMKVAMKIIRQKKPIIWDILEKIIKDHPVLLNRAPTLHRFGIQAFEVNMIEGEAIQLHPLVCGGFNADFDGDQMAVHIPLTLEAQLEARKSMMADNNILSPANGEPILVPSQDIILGLHYLTIEKVQQNKDIQLITSHFEAQYLYENKLLKLHDQVTFLVKEYKKVNNDFIPSKRYIQTTIGRSILWGIIPKGLTFDLINQTLTKQLISKLIKYCYILLGKDTTVILCDNLKQIGFTFCTISGISISLDDMIIPKDKPKILNIADAKIKEIHKEFQQGLLTKDERFNKILEVWTLANIELTERLMSNLSSFKLKEGVQTVNSYNSIYMMSKSGARGSAAQIKQLAGMRGLMTKPDGSIIEDPIKNNLREGLTVYQYYTSSHGARKGLSDTALKTANSGYLTRRLVDVVQDVVISENNCKTSDGILIHLAEEESITDKFFGRMTAENIMTTNKVLIKKDTLLLYQHCNLLEKYNIRTIKIRSVVTCWSTTGVCAYCYGADLSTCNLSNEGLAVGVIAAQSIGEPGTQLTMRTFHIGGTANINLAISQSNITAKNNGLVVLINAQYVLNKNNDLIIYSKNAILNIVNNKKVLERYKLPYGSIIKKNIGDRVKSGEVIAQWDHNYNPIICEVKGYIKYVNLIEGRTCVTNTNYVTGKKTYIVDLSKSNLKNRPYLKIVNKQGKDVVYKGTDIPVKYFLPHKSIIQLYDGSIVNTGDTLARLPISYESTDITGGLPRVEELFEARQVKESAILAEASGIVIFPTEGKNRYRICIDNMNGDTVIMKIPSWKYLYVELGDYVDKGDPLTDGTISSHDVLRLNGIIYFTKFFIKEIKSIYQMQGVNINEKHIEVIIRQMLKTVTITDGGNTGLAENEILMISKIKNLNKFFLFNNLKPAKYNYNLLGITKAALANESFISAASFQETTKVLTDAAFTSKVDELKGLKENVIIGRLIPAGTGYNNNQKDKTE